MNSPIFYAILGAILAGISQLAAGMIIETHKKNQRSRITQINYRLVVRTELESVVRQLEKLKTALNDRGYYPFASLTSLRSRITRLEPNIAEIYKAGKDSSVQTAFVTTVTDLGDLAQDLEALEQYILNERNSYDEKVKEIDGSGTAPNTQESALPANSEINRNEESKAKEKLADVTRFAEQQRSARLVELVDVKRRCEELIEKFRS